ncbi:MAG: hypothetical protein IPK19_13215 [Chloroflexi bacterium]|nr:hypothetical protein [Chloroflexota bacterium]
MLGLWVLLIAAGVRYHAFLAGIKPEFAALRGRPGARDPGGGRRRGAGLSRPGHHLMPPAAPPPHPLWRLAGAVTVIVCVGVSGGHVVLTGTYLKVFNFQVRDSKGYRDGIDVALRLRLPGKYAGDHRRPA